MPRGDGTGPTGKGAGSGAGRGRCGGGGQPNGSARRGPVSGTREATDLPIEAATGAAQAAIAVEQELAALKERARQLCCQLRDVNQRIAQLQTDEADDLADGIWPC